MDELLPTARELMSDDYLAVRPASALLDAIAALEAGAEDTAFVIDEHDRFLGLLTEKDCLRALAARAYDGGIAETVQDVMTPPPAVVTPDTDAYTITQAFLANACGALPVMSGDEVVGAVSQIAILRALVAVSRQRGESLGSIEQTAGDLKGRPESKESMQRVFANMDRDQLTTLMRQNPRQDGQD